MNKIKEDIRKFNFKLKFLNWKRVNDSKLIGMAYDYVFELFIYENIEGFVYESILRELNSKEEYNKLINKVESLEEKVDKLKAWRESARDLLKDL